MRYLRGSVFLIFQQKQNIIGNGTYQINNYWKFNLLQLVFEDLVKKTPVEESGITKNKWTLTDL